VSKILVPDCGRWLGVAPGAFSGVRPEQALVTFERDIGRPVDIYHAYHVDDDVFPTAQEIAIARDPAHRRLLMLNWKPDRQLTWAQIADGAVDDRIDRLAERLKTVFPERFFLTIWHEPENDVDETPGSGRTAADYARMYAHVVTQLRAHGGTNAIMVMTYIGYPKWGEEPWFNQLYPGDSVVDWIGYDPYIQAVPNSGRENDFIDLADKRGPGWPGFYSWSGTAHPNKPLMMAEWGVFEKAGSPARKATIYSELVGQLAAFPRLKALSYFDSPDAPKGDTRIDSSPQALAAFRALAMSSELAGPRPPGR
jgi:hypothetical protein